MNGEFHSVTADMFTWLVGNANIGFGDSNRKFNDKFTDMVPDSVKIFIDSYWPESHLDVGKITLSAYGNIMSDDDQKRLVSQNMFSIGHGMNGDPIVMKWDDNGDVSVGYISHDEFWEDENINPVDCYENVFDSFTEFVYRMAEGKFIPCDCFSASEYNELKGSMKNET